MNDLIVFPNDAITVIHYNDRLGKLYEVYCARPNLHYRLKGSPLCNPDLLDGEHSRDQVCDAYEVYFTAQLESGFQLFVDELDRLIGIYKQYGKLSLMCWCAPKRCHCLTIKRYLSNRINHEKQ